MVESNRETKSNIFLKSKSERRMSWWGMVEEVWRKGPWTGEEDRLLLEYVRVHGEGRWNSVARLGGTTTLSSLSSRLFVCVCFHVYVIIFFFSSSEIRIFDFSK